MLRGNWGIVLTVIAGLIGSALIWVFFSPSRPPLPTYSYEQPRSDQEATRRTCQPKVLASIRDSRKAASESERCVKDAEDHRVQINDLIQQTRAANAAEAQAMLAFEAGLIGVIQTIGGFLTLLAAGAAAWYARAAAQASQHSYTAFLAVEGAFLIAEIIDGLRVFGDQPYWSFQLKVSNIGRSPVLIHSIIIEGEERRSERVIDSGKDYTSSRWEIGNPPDKKNYFSFMCEVVHSTAAQNKLAQRFLLLMTETEHSPSVMVLRGRVAPYDETKKKRHTLNAS